MGGLSCLEMATSTSASRFFMATGAHAPQDVHIQALITAAGLHSRTPPGATHMSGSAIDIVLSPVSTPLFAGIMPNVIGLSDHKLVFCTVPLSILSRSSTVLGRVGWTEEGWEAALFRVQPLLVQLSNAIQPLVSDNTLLPKMLGGTSRIRQRRALLDAAAWSRNVLYVLAGHFASRLRCIVHARKNGDPCASVLQPGAYATHKEFKAAVGREVWLAQQRAVDKYMDLRQSKSSVAERFLSKCLAPRKGFLIALTSTESAQPLSVTEMLATMVGDLQSRASNQFPQDQTWKAEMQNSVGTIRRSGDARSAWDPRLLPNPSPLRTRAMR